MPLVDKPEKPGIGGHRRLDGVEKVEEPRLAGLDSFIDRGDDLGIEPRRAQNRLYILEFCRRAGIAASGGEKRESARE